MSRLWREADLDRKGLKIVAGRDHSPAVARLAFSLSTPPSVNDCNANLKTGGRCKTRAYRDWHKAAHGELLAKRAAGQMPGHIEGRYKIWLAFGHHRGDIDNRIKPLLDFLVSCGLTPDDKHCDAVHAVWAEDVGAYRVNIQIEKATCDE